MKDNIVKHFSLNKDFVLENKVHYLEYMAYEDVSVTLYEKNKAVFADMIVGGIRKGFMFEKCDGVYNFRRFLGKGDEVAIQFYKADEMLELTIPPECVKLTF